MRSSFPLCLALLLAVPATARAADAKDRTFDPTSRVGAIGESTSEADLVAIYGSKAVTRTGEDGRTTVLFAGTPDQLSIEWKADRRIPARIFIDGAAWVAMDGLSVTASLHDLERINGGPFDVTGANWDRPVRVVSWKGGRLPPQLQADLGMPASDEKLPPKLRSARLFFESTHPVLRDSRLVVKRLILEW